MNNLGYDINGDKAAKLIASNIYNQISSIIEMVANYYDADATEVKINFNEENNAINEIIIVGNGDGFKKEDLYNIKEIGDSKKKTDIYTKKFKRVKLGSFGIAITAFQNLGNTLEIYSRSQLGTTLHRKIFINEGNSVFSDVKKVEDNSNIIKYDTGCTLIIRGCNIEKNIFTEFDLLKNKLAYLPISQKFKVYLQDEEIVRIIVEGEGIYKLSFEFDIDKVEFYGYVYYSPKAIKNRYFRGVFLQVDDRILDWNIFNDIRQSITSPGAVENKIQGYIIADSIRNKINASRTGLTDTYLALSIADNLKKKISNINKKAKEYYGWEKAKSKGKCKGKGETSKKSDIDNTSEDSQSKNTNTYTGISASHSNLTTIFEKEQYNRAKRKTEAEKRIRDINMDLKRLEVKFQYEPESEIEVIIIASQLWQKGVLDFEIIQAISSEYPDSIIRKDGELAFLEFEQTLNNFYRHEHNHNNIDYILCWSIDKKTIDKDVEKYLKKYSSYIKAIEPNESLKDRYCDELLFRNYDGTEHSVKLYILSDIIKKL